LHVLFVVHRRFLSYYESSIDHPVNIRQELF
jgi:hypothetical protein